MASFARPGGYDDSSEDEFDGFVFDDSYDGHEEADFNVSSHRDKDFVPTVSCMVKKSQEAMNSTGDQTSSELAGGSSSGFKPRSPSDSSLADSSGSVKFSLDAATMNGLHHHDATLMKTDSPIKSAHLISDGRIRNSLGRPRGRVQRESRRRHDRQLSEDQDKRSKGQLKGAEESENLRIAVQRGNVTQVKRILENGFDPNTILTSGWTALMHSCDSANLEVTELLLDHGANPKTRKDQYTALMALCARKSESKGQIETARLLINRGAVVNSHDRHKMSPLLYACQGGHLGLAELLVSVNADVNKQDSRGWTPLHYAANQGNFQLAQLLVESNANTEITCNLGDTPASVAYNNDHTELRDWLESITSSSSSSRGGNATRDSITLPTFAENRQSARAPSSDVMMTSSSSTTLPVAAAAAKPATTPSGAEDVSFGDLELFLKGEQLWQLMPLFREHRVEFTDLLNMTDEDLEQMGISEIGVRKKILSSVAAVHKKEWHMPRNTLPRHSVLSAMEAAFILSNLARHSTYIKATATHLLSHVRSNKDMIGPHLLPNERDRLTSDLSGAAAAVSSLQEEVLTLQREVNLALSQAPPTPTNLPVRRCRGLLLLKLVGGMGLVTCVAYLTGRTVIKYLSS